MSAKASLRAVGEQIASHGTPEAAGPLVIAVTGRVELFLAFPFMA